MGDEPKGETPVQKKPRRKAVPVSERLAALDERIAGHEQAIAKLREQRKEMVRQQRIKAERLLDEVRAAELPVTKREEPTQPEA